MAFARGRWRRLPSWLKAAAVVLVMVVACVVPLVVFWLPGEAASAGPSDSVAAEGSVAASSSTTMPVTTSTTEGPVEITIAAVGDVMTHRPTLRAAEQAGTGDSYDFNPIFTAIAPYLRSADYTVVNLETRLAGHQFGYSSFPKFNSPGELADALAAAGVDLCTTASNHSLDRGWQGIVNTLDRLDQAGIAHIGTNRTAQERDTPFIVDIKGIKVAFLNFTDINNGWTPPNDYAVNWLGNTDHVAAAAKAARDAGADVVICFLHWGREYEITPVRKQIVYAEGSDTQPGLLAEGVDVILGSHPHVVQPAVGVVQNTPSGPKNTYVVYSMGNFLSNMLQWRTDSGVIVYVHIKKTGDKVEVTGLSYMGAYVLRVGDYDCTVTVKPVLPDGKAAPGDPVGTKEQQRINKVWDYLNDMFYDPDTNIVPVSPDEVAGAH